MKFAFNGKSLALQDRPIFSGNRVTGTLDGQQHDAVLRSSHGNTVIWDFVGRNLEWRWQWSVSGGRLRVENQFINHSGQAIALGEMTLLDAAPCSLRHAKGVVSSLIACGANSRRKFFPEMQLAAAADAIRESAVKCDFFAPQEPLALQIGFLSFQRVMTMVRFSGTPQSDVASVSALMDFAGWRLAPGTTTSGEVFTIAADADPFLLLEEWADLAAAIIKPRFRRQPALGISGGAWGLGGFANTEEFKLGNARRAVARLQGFGLEFVWISIANLPGGNPGAWTEWNYKNLPSGIAHVVSELDKCGLKLGFWFSPFMLSSHLADLVAEMDDAILRDPTGAKLIYYPLWSHGDAGLLPVKERPCCYALDPTHPKTHALVRHGLQRYREAGVRYYMVDFLEAGAGMIQRHPYLTHHNQALVAGPEAFVSGMRVVREAAGDDCFLLASTGPFLYDAGLVDAVRVGNDFGEGRRIMPNSGFYPASFVINGSFTAAATALKCAAVQYYTHNRLYQNDSGNVLTVDLPLPLEAARIHATIHAFSGSSSMLGDNLCDISDERLALVKKTLPRDGQMAKPLDLFSAAPHAPRLFLRQVSQPWGDYVVLAIYNLSGQARRERLPFQLLGLADGVTCQAWEFWGESYLGSVTAALDVEIPAESVRVFRLTPLRDIPMVIGSDMHLLMGLKEITACRWDAAEQSLTVTLTRPTGEKGALFCHMPEGWHVANASGFHIARNRDGTKGELLIHVPCDFTQTEITKKIIFGKHTSKADDTRM